MLLSRARFWPNMPIAASMPSITFITMISLEDCFTSQLVNAAGRGIRVRVLVDDMDLAGRDLGAAVLDSHPNMEVRIFNPFSRQTSRTSQYVTRLGSVTREIPQGSAARRRRAVRNES